MKTFMLPYGTSEIPIHIPAECTADLITPLSVAPAADPLSTVRNAILHPVGDYFLKAVTAQTRVAIAINDKTRPVPHQYLLPPLLDELTKRGVPREAILLIIATGTHLPMQPLEFGRIIPEEILKQFEVISHNCDEHENLMNLGFTKQGTPIWVNRQYYQADLKVVVGNIEPHHFMGFSGGVKSAAIGLAGRETINCNHTMITHPNAIMGLFEDNPMRQDIEEIGIRIGVDLALNAVLNTELEIVETFWGDPVSVMQAGIPASKRICQVPIERQYDIVIASAGGAPKDINFYQAQKALTHAARVAKPGGTIILAAQCPEGIGSATYEKFMQGVCSVSEVFEKFTREGFRVGPHKAFQVARLLASQHIILVSDMNRDLVSQFLLKAASSLNEALLLASVGIPQPTIAILPHATQTISNLVI